MINDSIEIKIVEVNGDKIKVGITAPNDVKILRSELCRTIEANKDSANAKPNQQLKELLKNKKRSKGL